MKSQNVVGVGRRPAVPVLAALVGVLALLLAAAPVAAEPLGDVTVSVYLVEPDGHVRFFAWHGQPGAGVELSREHELDVGPPPDLGAGSGAPHGYLEVDVDATEGTVTVRPGPLEPPLVATSLSVEVSSRTLRLAHPVADHLFADPLSVQATTGPIAFGGSYLRWRSRDGAGAAVAPEGEARFVLSTGPALAPPPPLELPASARATEVVDVLGAGCPDGDVTVEVALRGATDERLPWDERPVGAAGTWSSNLDLGLFSMLVSDLERVEVAASCLLPDGGLITYPPAAVAVEPAPPVVVPGTPPAPPTTPAGPAAPVGDPAAVPTVVAGVQQAAPAVAVAAEPRFTG